MTGPRHLDRLRPWAMTATLVILALACSEGEPEAPPTSPDTSGEAPVTFHCGFDSGCPEVLIAGDPHATLAGAPAPFRGYGDPSLEYDASTGTLWLSYSWLDVLISDPGPSPVIDFGVRTHLARSQDNGRTFTHVGPVNATTPRDHPDTGAAGWMIHEVSTLVRAGPENWQILWLGYFEPMGDVPGPEGERRDFHYLRSTAGRPEDLGVDVQAWVRGPATSPAFGARHDLSQIPELADCAGFTEPALYADDTGTYLATGCIVFEGGRRREARERLALLREEPDGYAYVGDLLDGEDAARFDADRLEQADLALSRSGDVLLTVTPIRTGADPQHRGCLVFEVADLSRAAVRRNADRRPISRAVITADGNGLGPGLCTYDAASETGLLLVITQFDLAAEPVDLLFSLRATGIHP